MEVKDVDTANKFMVSSSGDRIAMLLPPTQRMSKIEALTLAAWLVVTADDYEDNFGIIVEAVQNT